MKIKHHELMIFIRVLVSSFVLNVVALPVHSRAYSFCCSLLNSKAKARWRVGGREADEKASLCKDNISTCISSTPDRPGSLWLYRSSSAAATPVPRCLHYSKQEKTRIHSCCCCCCYCCCRLCDHHSRKVVR